MKLILTKCLITLALLNCNSINAKEKRIAIQDTVAIETTNYDYADKLLKELIHKTELPGLSISVNKNGNLLYSKGFGFADIDGGIKMTPTHQIRTASVAKMITATALGKLCSDGKLEFDSAIKKYIPSLKEPYASLTIRQIAGHTAGIEHRPPSKNSKNYETVEKTIKQLQKQSLLFTPDTDYKYSSFGYSLLGAIIEKVSGKKYIDYMNEDIFNPLGMTQTFADNYKEFSSKDAKMYYFKDDELKLDTKAIDGSYKLAGAGFRSTSVDLAKMMNAYTNGFLDKAVIEDMFSGNTLKNGNKTNVGIGWRLNRDVDDNATIEHAGSWQGARTVIIHYPKEKLSISMMVNAQCTLFIEETTHLIAQLFLNESIDINSLEGITETLTITNNRQDGSTENYTGQINFTSNNEGLLEIDTDKKWLTSNRIYAIDNQQKFALSTKYGLLYLNLNTKPTLDGSVFQYQVLGDTYHSTKEPMLEIKSPQ